MSIHPITLALFLGIETVNKKKEHEIQIICVFDKENDGYGASKLLKRSTLSEKKSELLPSDVLTIVCTVDYYFRTSDDTGNTIIAEYKKLLVGECASSREQKCLDKPIRCPACNSVIALRVRFDHACEAVTIKDDYLKCCRMKSSRKNESRPPSEACGHPHRKCKKHSSKHRHHSHSGSRSDSEYVCCKHKSRRKKKHKSRPRSSSQSECKPIDTSICLDDHKLKQNCYLRPSKMESSTKEETRTPPLPVLNKMVNHDLQLSDVFLKLDGEQLSFPLVTDRLSLADLLLVLPLPKPILRDASHQSLLSHLKNSEETCQLLNIAESTCISSLLDALDFTTIGFIELKEENSEGRSHNGEISQLLNCLIQKNPVVFDDSICDDVSPPLYMNSP